MPAAPLSHSQVTVLKLLAAAPRGLDTDALKKRVPNGVAVNAGNIGPVFANVLHNYPESLYGRGLVVPSKLEGDRVVWRITAKGRAAADEYRTLKFTGARVPPAILDPAIRAFSKLRTYGLEFYTDADLEELRANLGDDYASLDLYALRMQIVNRRKQGAFQSPATKLHRQLRQFQRTAEQHGIELSPAGRAKLSGLLAQFAEE